MVGVIGRRRNSSATPAVPSRHRTSSAGVIKPLGTDITVASTQG
jgi:hypothetical protein